MAESFRAAAVIASPHIFDLERTVDKCCSIIDEAASKGAQLVVFPETFLPMYPWWIWMAVDNVKRGQLYRRLFEQSVDLHGPELQRLCQRARQRSVYLVVGINERDGGTLYNSQVFIDEQGQLVRCRRKLIPTGEERTLWGRGDGSDLFVLDTRLGRLGALICYENIMPLSRYTLYSMGEQIHVANWPGNDLKSQPRDRTQVIETTSRFAAIEGQMFVLASSSCIGQEEVDFYKELDPAMGANLTVGGGIAAIYSPYGQTLSEPIVGQEGISYADIDLDLIASAKHIIDTVGHYARPDVARVVFNDRRMRPVSVARGVASHQEESAEAQAGSRCDTEEEIA